MVNSWSRLLPEFFNNPDGCGFILELLNAALTKLKHISAIFTICIYFLHNLSLMVQLMDYGCPESKKPSLHGQKFNPNPKLLGTAKAYFVCHIVPLGVRSPWFNFFDWNLFRKSNPSRIPVGFLLTKEAGIVYCPYYFEKKSPPTLTLRWLWTKEWKNANKAGLIDSSL